MSAQFRAPAIQIGLRAQGQASEFRAHVALCLSRQGGHGLGRVDQGNFNFVQRQHGPIGGDDALQFIETALQKFQVQPGVQRVIRGQIVAQVLDRQFKRIQAVARHAGLRNGHQAHAQNCREQESQTNNDESLITTHSRILRMDI